MFLALHGCKYLAQRTADPMFTSRSPLEQGNMKPQLGRKVKEAIVRETTLAEFTLAQPFAQLLLLDGRTSSIRHILLYLAWQLKTCQQHSRAVVTRPDFHQQ
eukprot:300389-Amphidinium_carterae.2